MAISQALTITIGKKKAIEAIKRLLQGPDDLCKEYKGYLIYGELVVGVQPRISCDVCNASRCWRMA
jgi:hypothetical protein